MSAPRRILQAFAGALLALATTQPSPAAADGDALPTTLPGGSVIATAALAKLTQGGSIVLIDVGPFPRRPDVDAGAEPRSKSESKSGALPWLPPPHRSLPNSVWIPGAGTGTVPEPMARYFRNRLAQLTGGDRDRCIVVYCHPNCPMSFNAARRAVGAGYRRVIWYPDGVEGWQEAGLATVVTKPEGPDVK